MHPKLLVLFFLLPCSLFAQTSSFDDCDKVFTKVQQVPSLKISTEKFNDTLAVTLQANEFALKNNDITLKFVVTLHGKIDEITIDAGSVRNINSLFNSITSLAGLWKPATQNGYDVCAYVKLRLVFKDRKVSAEVLP